MTTLADREKRRTVKSFISQPQSVNFDSGVFGEKKQEESNQVLSSAEQEESNQVLSSAEQEVNNQVLSSAEQEVNKTNNEPLNAKIRNEKNIVDINVQPKKETILKQENEPKQQYLHRSYSILPEHFKQINIKAATTGMDKSAIVREALDLYFSVNKETL